MRDAARKREASVPPVRERHFSMRLDNLVWPGSVSWLAPKQITKLHLCKNPDDREWNRRGPGLLSTNPVSPFIREGRLQVGLRQVFWLPAFEAICKKPHRSTAPSHRRNARQQWQNAVLLAGHSGASAADFHGLPYARNTHAGLTCDGSVYTTSEETVNSSLDRIVRCFDGYRLSPVLT